MLYEPDQCIFVDCNIYNYPKLKFVWLIRRLHNTCRLHQVCRIDQSIFSSAMIISFFIRIVIIAMLVGTSALVFKIKSTQIASQVMSDTGYTGACIYYSFIPTNTSSISKIFCDIANSEMVESASHPHPHTYGGALSFKEIGSTINL